MKEKEKGKLDFIKIKKFCSTKDMVKKVKDKPQKGEDIFKTKIKHILKNKVNNNNRKQPNLKLGKGLEWTFLQRRYTNCQ